MNTCKWHNKDLIPYIDEFNELYSNRPIKDNHGGMMSSHMFLAWFMVKDIKPQYLIESGIFKGQGTWFLEKASPETQMICIDPALSQRQYISTKAKYQTQDFLQTNWSYLPKDSTLIFFDDHQDFVPRLSHAHSFGFTKLIYEDNYPSQQGDCYSPKKIISNKDYVIDQGGDRKWHKKVTRDLEYFQKHVTLYQEMPPLFRSEYTRWGDRWDDVNYPTPAPLLELKEKETYPVFFEEKTDYTWMCYMEIM